MTDDQLVNNLIWMGATGLAFMGETIALLSPLHLARLAWLPIEGARRVALGRHLRALLASPLLAGSYRQSGAGALSLGGLATIWPMEPVPIAGRMLDLDADRSVAALRIKFDGSLFALGGVVRVRLRLEGDELCMTARAYPYLSLTFTMFFTAVTAIAFKTGAPFMAVVFVAIWAPILLVIALRGRRAAKPYAAAAMDAVVNRLRSYEASAS